MAFDEKLAERIRKQLAKQKGLSEKQMFGGLAFLVYGNMSVGIHGDSLIVRLAPSETDKALAQKHVRVFDLTGRPMRGWILVGPDGISTDSALTKWVDTGVRYAAALPKK